MHHSRYAFAHTVLQEGLEEAEGERRNEKEEPNFFGRPSAAATEGPEIWTFAL